MSIRDEKKENDLIYQTLLKEEQTGGGGFAGRGRYEDEGLGQGVETSDDPDDPAFNKSASEGESNDVKVGATNEDDLAQKKEMAQAALLEIVQTLTVDVQADVWKAILEDLNIAGRVLQRWKHPKAQIMLQSLLEHNEKDHINNVMPPEFLPLPDPAVTNAQEDEHGNSRIA